MCRSCASPPDYEEGLSNPNPKRFIGYAKCTCGGEYPISQIGCGDIIIDTCNRCNT